MENTSFTPVYTNVQRPKLTKYDDTFKIAIDFDGTIVDHRYPEIGEQLPFALPALHALLKHGHKLILWTMRSGDELSQAVRYLEERGLTLWGVNESPGQGSWTQSPKAYAHMYVDDAAIGTPLIFSPGMSRPGVDWKSLLLMFNQMGVIDAQSLALALQGFT